jgi:hypothetical protein
LLVLMERQQSKICAPARSGAPRHRAEGPLDAARRAVSSTIPASKDFLPHIQCSTWRGRQLGVDTSQGDSQHMIKVEKRDWQPVQREICIDEIQTLLSLRYPSQSAEDKKNKLKAILAALRRHLDGDRGR